MFSTKSIRQAEAFLPENSGRLEVAGAASGKPVWGPAIFPSCTPTLATVAEGKDEGVSRTDQCLEKQGLTPYFLALLSGGAQSRGHALCDIRSCRMEAVWPGVGGRRQFNRLLSLDCLAGKWHFTDGS